MSAIRKNGSRSYHALRDVHEHLAASAAHEDLDKRVALVEKALFIAQSYEQENPSNAEASFALGLCWYNYPATSQERTENIEKWLRKAIEIEPNHQFANLYLGHFFFDEGRYDEALIRFEQVNPIHFKEIDQTWRAIKLRELVICCQLYLEWQQVSSSAFQKLLGEYLSLSIEEAPHPVELVSCLVSLSRTINPYPEKLKAFNSAVIEALSAMEIDSLFDSEIQSLRESLPTGISLPFSEDDIEISLWFEEDKDGNVDLSRSKGVRVKHLPSGIEIISYSEVTQIENKESALQKLAERLRKKQS